MAHQQGLPPGSPRTPQSFGTPRKKSAADDGRNEPTRRTRKRRHIGIRAGQLTPHPIQANNRAGSFDDDDEPVIAELMNDYLQTHHADFVRWGNLQLRQTAALARKMVQTLHEKPELLTPTQQGG